MQLKLPQPQRLGCWCCGAPATAVRPWHLYLINNHERRNTDRALGQETTIDMPICANCQANIRQANRTGWLVALIAFATGFIAGVVLMLAKVIDLPPKEGLIVAAILGFIPCIIAWAFYTKSIKRKKTGFHPDRLKGHPIFGFFHQYGWRDDIKADSMYHPNHEDIYRVSYVTYLRWLQCNYGYRIIDDAGRSVNLTGPEFSGNITPSLARHVAIYFNRITPFQSKNARYLQQNKM